MAQPVRTVETAELLSVGSELTVGETRDTNAGELARELTELGVRVVRLQALPDDLDTVAGAFADALERADLVVSTGGLGPTPDDLTREAIARVWGESVHVDPDLERWLRALWARRRMPFPEINLKQAWLIPSAEPLPNPHGTAPGWWVSRADGRVAVALPGPPREMRPMWHDLVVPRLQERGVGRETETRTLRLFGLGESQIADLLGEAVLRSPNPVVATYARSDAVDVRISAVASHGRSAAAIADGAEALVTGRLGEYVWSRGRTTWREALESALARHGWALATSEAATGGTLAALLSSSPALRLAEIRPAARGEGLEGLAGEAERVREAGGAEVGLALIAGDRGHDTAVAVALATPRGVVREDRVAFLRGEHGRHRAALVAADILLRVLRQTEGQ